MESIAAFEPLLRTEVGGKPRAKCDARIEALRDSRLRAGHLGLGAAGYITLADHMVQLCASSGGCIHSPYGTGLGNRHSRRSRRLRRYRSTVGVEGLCWPRFYGH